MFKAFLFSLAIALSSATAAGDIIIQVDSKPFAAGGMGFVDVFISSDGVGVDELSIANYEFAIFATGPNGTANGELLFRPDAEQSSDEQFDPAYVFFGDNGGITAHVSPGQTTIQGTDVNGSGTNVLLSTTPSLLARFELVHNAPIPSLAVGDTFTIGLINHDKGNADPFDDSTFFADNALYLPPYQLGSDPASFTNLGTITITEAAAVPEPGTFGLMGLVAAGGLYRRLRRKLS